MNRFASLGVCALILCALPLILGCGTSELPKRKVYPTRGTLRMNGEPVRFAAVFLTPKDPTKGADADGDTDENGVFTLRTYSNGDPDGAVPGTYSVIINGYNPTGKPPMPEGVTPTKLPKIPLELEATVEVTADDNDLVIDIP